jgi:uncharacterized protein (TIGR02599 family)
MKLPGPAVSKSSRRAGNTARLGPVHFAQAFTLVELLLSMTILSVLMIVVVNVIGVVQQQWTRSNSRVTAFREARMAFDLLSRNLTQATLNTYWMAETNPLGFDAAAQQILGAKGYVRQSELEFVSGPTVSILTAATGSPNLYPGHAVFFQAPLGVTKLVTAQGLAADTENMTNLLCGRGYFVSWGSDETFRPPFLPASTVPLRFRYRLMEYSPTAESNKIYYDPAHAGDLAGRLPITAVSRRRQWFQDAISGAQSTPETAANHAFTRPVADNIIALIISPQYELSQSQPNPESLAPLYLYDSAMTANPGAAAPSSASPQGTQHLLPPLLKITMVSLDSAAGERLAESNNSGQQQRLAETLTPMFRSAAGYNNPTSTYRQELVSLQDFLVKEHLNFRVFTTTVVMKQAEWSH